MPIYAYKCGSCGHAKDVLETTPYLLCLPEGHEVSGDSLEPDLAAVSCDCERVARPQEIRRRRPGAFCGKDDLFDFKVEPIGRRQLTINLR